jgi:PAS domain S-box-containing protein
VASQTRLFQFLDALPVAVTIRTGSGRPYYANNEAERLLGPSVHAEIVDGDLPGLYRAYAENTGQLYPARDTAHARAVRGEHAHLDDVEIHRPGGGVTAMEVWGTPICGPPGAVDYTIAAFTDVSDRKAAERALSDQASLLNLAHDAILVRDAGQVITFWNRGAELTYGFTRGEAVGQVASGLLRTEYPAGDPDVELAGSGSWQGELVQTRRDGRRVVLASRWAARVAPDGARRGVMEVNRDITAARDAQRYARSLIEASQDPLLVINPTGTITDVTSITGDRELDSEVDDSIELEIRQGTAISGNTWPWLTYCTVPAFGSIVAANSVIDACSTPGTRIAVFTASSTRRAPRKSSPSWVSARTAPCAMQPIIAECTPCPVASPITSRIRPPASLR